MELFEVRKIFKAQLQKNGIDVVDADFIIANVLDVPVAQLALIQQITTSQYKQIASKVKLRCKHMPVDKIFKTKYFYGRPFITNKHVLSPRQDSEILIEYAQKIIELNKYTLCLDLCTGSGCLAITINKQTGINVVATDVSLSALKTAKQNAKLNNAKVDFKQSDMFKKVTGKFDVIISNPPYIETSTIPQLEPEVVKYDPILALDGGKDGLDFYKIIAQNANNYLNKNGYVIMEIGYNQKQAVKQIFKQYKYIKCLKDLNGLDRVIIFRSKV